MPILYTRRIHRLFSLSTCHPQTSLPSSPFPPLAPSILLPRILGLHNPHHRQQPPRCVARLGPHADPVLRPRNVQLDVLVQRARFVVRVALGDGVVRPEDLEGAGVAGGSGGRVRSSPVRVGGLQEGSGLPCVGHDNVVKGGVGTAKAREADFEDHGCGGAGDVVGWGSSRLSRFEVQAGPGSTGGNFGASHMYNVNSVQLWLDRGRGW